MIVSNLLQLNKICLEQSKTAKFRQRFQVSGISVSEGKDQLVIIHLASKSDFAFCLQTANGENRVAELVGVLVNRIRQ